MAPSGSLLCNTQGLSGNKERCRTGAEGPSSWGAGGGQGKLTHWKGPLIGKEGEAQGFLKECSRFYRDYRCNEPTR